MSQSTIFQSNMFLKRLSVGRKEYIKELKMKNVQVGIFPGLNIYLAEDKVFCSRTQHSTSGEALDLKLSTLPMSHYTLVLNCLAVLFFCCKF